MAALLPPRRASPSSRAASRQEEIDLLESLKRAGVQDRVDGRQSPAAPARRWRATRQAGASSPPGWRRWARSRRRWTCFGEGGCGARGAAALRVDLSVPAGRGEPAQHRPRWRGAFDVPIGFSDHTLGIAVPLAAVALGACIIEKHFTVDKALEGWDHAISADPAELRGAGAGRARGLPALGSPERTSALRSVEKRKAFRRRAVAVAHSEGGAARRGLGPRLQASRHRNRARRARLRRGPDAAPGHPGGRRARVGRSLLAAGATRNMKVLLFGDGEWAAGSLRRLRRARPRGCWAWSCAGRPPTRRSGTPPATLGIAGPPAGERQRSGLRGGDPPAGAGAQRLGLVRSDPPASDARDCPPGIHQPPRGQAAAVPGTQRHQLGADQRRDARSGSRRTSWTRGSTRETSFCRRTLPIGWTDTYGDVLERVVAALPDLVARTPSSLIEARRARAAAPSPRAPGPTSAGAARATSGWTGRIRAATSTTRSGRSAGPARAPGRSLDGSPGRDLARVLRSGLAEVPGHARARSSAAPTDDGVVVKTGDSTLLRRGDAGVRRIAVAPARRGASARGWAETAPPCSRHCSIGLDGSGASAASQGDTHVGIALAERDSRARSIAPSATITDAIARLDGAGTGALLLCDEAGRLCGTPDRRRHPPRDPRGCPVDRPVRRRSPRRSPSCGRPDLGSAEALQLMDTRATSSNQLPLVDPTAAGRGLLLRSDLVAEERCRSRRSSWRAAFGTRLLPADRQHAQADAAGRATGRSSSRTIEQAARGRAFATSTSRRTIWPTRSRTTSATAGPRRRHHVRRRGAPARHRRRRCDSWSSRPNPSSSSTATS